MKFKLNKLDLVCLCLLWAPYTLTVSQASEAELVTLPDMVIEDESAENITHISHSKNDFNRADLDAVNRADLNGVIRSLPSTEISQANGNGSSRINLRGAGGGLGLVNLDGIPLFGNFTSFFPLSHYPLDLLDRVSVIRGNDGAQTSSRTLGGSLNLTSRQLNNEQAFLHTEGGSYGTLRNNVGMGTHNKLGNWTVAGGQTNIFEGISQASPANGGSNERDNSQLSTGLLRWDKHFKDISLESSLYYVNGRDAYDGPGQLANGLRGWKDDPNSLVKQQTWLAQSQANYHLSEHWNSTLQIGFTKDQQAGRIGSLKNCCSMDLSSQLLLAHWRNTHKILLDNQSQNSLNVIWGIDAQQQHGESPSNPAKVYALTNNLVSPIARAEIEWGQWLTGAEVRLDHYDQLGGDHVLFNINNNWRFISTMTLWTKVGTGYRTPSINERLHPLFGTIHLAPESNVGGEIGWRWQPTRSYEITTSTYLQHYHNLIVLQQSASGSIKSVNINEAHILGVEAQTNLQWHKNWKSGFSYTYMMANNPQTGYKIPNRPNHQGQFWTEWKMLPPLTLRIDLTYREGYCADSLNTIQIKAAPRVNASINYQVTPKIKLTLRGENINNQRTPDLYGFNYPGAAIYGGAYLDW